MFEQFSIPSLQFFESIIKPAFADLVPEGFPFHGLLNEFTIMPNVPSSRTIVDIKRTQNILQRRDKSCDIVYKKVFGATTRKITTDEIYGATKICKNEFYQGCLKDWRAGDPIFAEKILPYFQEAVNTDIASNAYFGDISRVTTGTEIWSTDIFDGVFKWISTYSTAGVIPAGQTISIDSDEDYFTTPADAFHLIESMYNKQPVLMKAFTPLQKAFYVSQEIAEGYVRYLTSVGLNAAGYSVIINGISVIAYQGIPILTETIWTPILTEINGGDPAYAAVLTVRGNFVFATDENYGEGPDDKTALMVWYDWNSLSWKYALFLKAGTQIALPEFIVYALTDMS